jgi:hypothetical protein
MLVDLHGGHKIRSTRIGRDASAVFQIRDAVVAARRAPATTGVQHHPAKDMCDAVI